EVQIAVLVGHELQIVHAEGHLLLAHAEEATDIDQHRVNLTILGQDHVADLSDVFVIGAVDGGTDEILCTDLVDRLLLEGRAVDRPGLRFIRTGGVLVVSRGLSGLLLGAGSSLVVSRGLSGLLLGAGSSLVVSRSLGGLLLGAGSALVVSRGLSGLLLGAGSALVVSRSLGGLLLGAGSALVIGRSLGGHLVVGGLLRRGRFVSA